MAARIGLDLADYTNESVERLWRRVQSLNQGPEPCWPWPWAHGRYGQAHIVRNGKQRCVGVHRFVLAYTTGPLGPDDYALHECDHTLCVNPDPAHIGRGTAQRNIHDAVTRGLFPQGERHPNTHKTECPQGHPYDDHNTRINNRGSRVCRICESRAYRGR